MPSVLKTSQNKHSSKTVTTIITLHKNGRLLVQIGDQLTLSQFPVATILYRNATEPDQLVQLSKRSGSSYKLNDQDRKIFIFYMSNFYKIISRPLILSQNPVIHFQKHT